MAEVGQMEQSHDGLVDGLAYVRGTLARMQEILYEYPHPAGERDLHQGACRRYII